MQRDVERVRAPPDARDRLSLPERLRQRRPAVGRCGSAHTSPIDPPASRSPDPAHGRVGGHPTPHDQVPVVRISSPPDPREKRASQADVGESPTHAARGRARSGLAYAAHLQAEVAGLDHDHHTLRLQARIEERRDCLDLRDWISEITALYGWPNWSSCRPSTERCPTVHPREGRCLWSPLGGASTSTQTQQRRPLPEDRVEHTPVAEVGRRSWSSPAAGAGDTRRLEALVGVDATQVVTERIAGAGTTHTRMGPTPAGRYSRTIHSSPS